VEQLQAAQVAQAGQQVSHVGPAVHHLARDTPNIVGPLAEFPVSAAHLNVVCIQHGNDPILLLRTIRVRLSVRAHGAPLLP